MLEIRKVDKKDKKAIKTVAELHGKAFQGFFLTFLGKGFLKQMYTAYSRYKESGILAAYDNGKLVGFLAYSGDLSGLYKYMLRSRILLFAWYSLGAFIRKPKIFFRLVGAFFKPKGVKRKEKYIELASLAVSPDQENKGIGSALVNELKKFFDKDKYAYVTLETDAENNDATNKFYVKNGFTLFREFTTAQGRVMNEYRYGDENISA